MISKKTILYLLTLCLIIIGLIVVSGKYNQKKLEAGYSERAEKNILQELIQQTDDKNPIINSSLLGKTVVINVWASWCQPCIREIPELNKLKKEFDTKNISFIALNARDSSKEARIMENRNINFDYDLHFDQEELIQLLYTFNLKQENQALPLNVVLNQEGKPEFFYSSYKPEKLNEMRTYLNELSN